MKRRVNLAMGALLLCLPAVGTAQTGAGLVAGQTRVRVSVTHPESIRVAAGTLRKADHRDVLVGTFQGLGESGIFIRDGKEDLEFVVPMGSVGRIDVSQGQHSHIGRGALIGVLAGGVGGAVTGFVLCAGDNCETSGIDNERSIAAVVLGLGGAVAGLGIGALAGSMVRSETWEAWPVGNLKLGFGPGPEGGVQFGLVLGFGG